MKKIFFVLFALVLIFTVKSVEAVTPTSEPTDTPVAKKTTPTPTAAAQDAQIEKIKDLVASRVAELKLVDKRGVLGYVKSSTNTEITINGNRGEIKSDVDELTKFESPSDKGSFGISDIKSGDLLSIVGLYNKETERILARFVSVASNIPENIEGVVTAIDPKNYTLTIATDDNKKIVVNVETSTKTSAYQDGDTLKSGFSKIDVGERLIVVGFTDKTDSNQINTERILHFPGMALSSNLTKYKSGK
ncbi:MAG TPA: hypothetical protein VG965_06545 [Patescibacteria group bacterium]|nr:hypothetical protein [Patescibacteria group bacterium]